MPSRYRRELRRRFRHRERQYFRKYGELLRVDKDRGYTHDMIVKCPDCQHFEIVQNVPRVIRDRVFRRENDDPDGGLGGFE